MPRASLDIGSNSILLLVVDDKGRVLHDDARVVGLGRGLGDRGLLRADRVDEALSTLADFTARAEGLGVPRGEVQAVATSALRRAHNGETFLARVRELCGVNVRVISGEDEARLTAAGALRGLELPPGLLLVVDPGGGSTEIALVRPDPAAPGGAAILHRHSYELGSVRLTEQYLAEEPVRPQAVARVRGHLSEALAGLHLEPPPRTVVAVAGTPTSLAAAEQGLAVFESDRVHGHTLELFNLRRWIDRFIHTTAQERRCLLPATPERADTILAGVLVLEQVLVQVQRTNLTVSARGLRFALV
jgi:exopolyphosphatase/guanosine-5'-triphosphate,3'-diphosphate pyrophosphatase